MGVFFDDMMYMLTNKCYLRISSTAGRTDEYSYDYFDRTKKLIDGGVIEMKPTSTEEVFAIVLDWCGLNIQATEWMLIKEGADNRYLEKEGFTGW